MCDPSFDLSLYKLTRNNFSAFLETVTSLHDHPSFLCLFRLRPLPTHYEDQQGSTDSTINFVIAQMASMDMNTSIQALSQVTKPLGTHCKALRCTLT